MDLFKIADWWMHMPKLFEGEGLRMSVFVKYLMFLSRKLIGNHDLRKGLQNKVEVNVSGKFS